MFFADLIDKTEEEKRRQEKLEEFAAEAAREMDVIASTLEEFLHDQTAEGTLENLYPTMVRCASVQELPPTVQTLLKHGQLLLAHNLYAYLHADRESNLVRHWMFFFAEACGGLHVAHDLRCIPLYRAIASEPTF